MTAPTAEEWARLRELAEAATPGPWTFRHAAGGQDRYVVGADGQLWEAVQDNWILVTRGEWGADKANAAFIAAANPAAVLALLDALDTADARIAALEAEVAAAKDSEGWRRANAAEERAMRAEDRARKAEETAAIRLSDREELIGQRDVARADLARVTDELAGLRAELSRWRVYCDDPHCADRDCPGTDRVEQLEGDLARVTGELAEANRSIELLMLCSTDEETAAAYARCRTREDRLEGQLTTSQRDRENLQGERDAARAVLKRALDRFEMRTREGIDTWEAIMEAARREAGLT